MALQREQIVQTAEKYVARGKIEPAIKEYRKLLAENPNDINTLNRVGDLYARIQRIDEAVDFFTQIAEQYTVEGFFVKAIAIYKKIIKLDPTRLEVYEQLAELYHKQGLVTEARTQYQVLADYYQKHANAASAIAIYQKMVELEPDNPTYHVKLAEIYHQQQLIEKAMWEYRLIAELMIKHGRPQEAAQVYERALDIDTQNIPFITDAVLKLREAGNVAGAAHFLAVAVDRNPAAERVAHMIGAAATEVEAEPEVVDAEPEPPPVSPARPAPARPAPAPAARRPVEIEEEEELDLTMDDDLSRAMAEAARAVGGEDAVEEEVEAAAAEEEGGEIELDLGDMFEIDLPDEDEEPTSLVKPPADLLEAPRRPAWAQSAAPSGDETVFLSRQPLSPEPPAAEEEEAEFELELDLDVQDFGQGFGGEMAVPEPSPAASAGDDYLDSTGSSPATEREEDLVTEAEVLAKYGLEDKAVERLEEALRLRPDHLNAYMLLIQLHLDKARHGKVKDLANRLAGYAAGRDPWPRVRKRLENAGYRLDGDRVLAAPGAVEPALAEPEPAELVLPDGIFDTGLDLPSAPEPAVEPDIELEIAPDTELVIELDTELDTELAAPLPDFAETAFLPEITAEPAVSEPAVSEPAPAPPPEPVAMAPVVPEPVSAPPPEPAPPAAPAPPPVRPAAAKPAAKKSDKVDDLLRGILGTPTKPRTPPAAPRPAAPPPVAAPPPPLQAAVPPPAAPAPAAAPPPPPPAAKSGPPPSSIFNPLQIGELVESLDVDDDEVLAAGGPVPHDASGLFTDLPPARPSAMTPAGVNRELLDDTGANWLDEPAPREATSADELFDEEDDFFDLAGELVEELSKEEVFQRDGMLVQSEQTLEEIVEGFKKGVAEHLSPTDYDTHFNLGIAYREMGLLDEAIGEFQLASKDARYLVLCCSMLGLCFLDKGLPELAIKWYRRALEFPGIGEEDHLGMMYDLGNVYMMLGDWDNAYKTFVDLYGINTNYRDVVAKLEELGRPR